MGRPAILGDSKIAKFCENKKALEIGGPSQVFLPLYEVLNSIDGVNHSNTIWQGKSIEGMNYRAKDKTGYQFVRDAIDLNILTKYDVVLASHVLEHIANPIKALLEWKKVLKKSGLMVLVVPSGSKKRTLF